MEEERYICIGICETDPETGYCIGCGRPPLPIPPADPPPLPLTPATPAAHPESESGDGPA